MTVEQVVINDKAIRAQAERLTATGWDGDAYRFVESLLLNAVADGYARIEPVPAPRGPSSTEEGRAKAREIFEETLRARSAGMVVEPIEPMPLCECGHHNDRHGLGAPCIKRRCSCQVYRPVIDR